MSVWWLSGGFVKFVTGLLRKLVELERRNPYNDMYKAIRSGKPGETRRRKAMGLRAETILPNGCQAAEVDLIFKQTSRKPNNPAHHRVFYFLSEGIIMFRKSFKGQGLVEYSLLLVIVAAGAIMVLVTLGGAVSDRYTEINCALESGADVCNGVASGGEGDGGTGEGGSEINTPAPNPGAPNDGSELGDGGPLPTQVATLAPTNEPPPPTEGLTTAGNQSTS